MHGQPFFIPLTKDTSHLAPGVSHVECIVGLSEKIDRVKTRPHFIIHSYKTYTMIYISFTVHDEIYKYIYILIHLKCIHVQWDVAEWSKINDENIES